MTPPRPVVLVTGAGRRVGRAIAIHLAGLGYDIAIHYHQSEREAMETRDACVAAGARAGARAECFAADLRDAGVAPDLVVRVVRAFGRLDALVNSAATMQLAALDTITPDEWDAIMAVNARAPFFLALAARAAMTHGGAIVNLADHLTEESWPRLVAHSISKAAVVAMTMQLAVQFAPLVRVNAVSPGAVLPPEHWPADAQASFVSETPLKRLGSPDDVAGAVAYLLSAPFVTGHVLVVDGGRRLR